MIVIRTTRIACQEIMSRSLYVGGLDEDVTEHVLRAAFIPFGNLKDAQLPLDKDGKSRGFAFIEFDEDEDAAAAIEARVRARLATRLAELVGGPAGGEGGRLGLEVTRMAAVDAVCAAPAEFSRTRSPY